MKNKSSQNKGVNLIITLYNENSKNRCLELFFCLKSNIENEHISKIHILYEDPDKDSFLFDIIANINSEKIIIQTITKRPTYNEESSTIRFIPVFNRTPTIPCPVTGLS